MRRGSKSQGFTLIELCVIIAIIAILAAILFPVFTKSCQTSCASNLTSCACNFKQLGMAFVQYVQDNIEHFPSVRAVIPDNYYVGGWANLIYPYVKSTAVFACLDDRSPRIASCGVTLQPGVKVLYTMNYVL